MRYFNRFLLTAILVVLSSSPLFAQGGGMSGGGGGGGAGGGGAGGGSSSSLGGSQLTTLGTMPTVIAPGQQGSTGSSTISQSNFLSPFFANPYYQGILSNQLSGNNNPGGFGTSLFGTSGTSTGGGMLGFAGTSTAGGASTGGGRVGGASGGGGTRGGSNMQSWMISNPSQFSARYVFAPKDMVQQTIASYSSRVQADVAGTLARTKDLPSAAAVEVTVEGHVVTLRGKVKDEDEFKNIYGLVLQTPGVFVINNYLTYPGQPARAPRKP